MRALFVEEIEVAIEERAHARDRRFEIDEQLAHDVAAHLDERADEAIEGLHVVDVGPAAIAIGEHRP